jgi:squalene synthase HpnC
LQKTINRFQLPPEPFRDLISAFIQDQEVLQYQSFEELLEYCRRSANPVGRIYLMLFNIKDDVAFALSDKICTALQLTNFWQDLCSDLFRGRIYLPLEDLKSQGYSLDDLFNKAYNQNFRQLMKFEVDRTRELFREGSELEKLLPNKIKFYIRLFRRGGEEILEKIKKIDFNVFLHRPTLSRWDKFRIFTSSLLAQV